MDYYNIQINAAKSAYMWNYTNKDPAIPKINNVNIEADNEMISL